MSNILYPVTPEEVVGVADSSKVLYVPRADKDTFGIVKPDEITVNLNNEDELQAIGLQTTEQLLTADQILTAITITYQED